MMARILLILVVILFMGLGVWIFRGHVDMIHWYHHQHVSEEKKPQYCHTMGSALCVIGAAEAIPLFLDSGLGIVLMLIGCGIGIAIIVYGQYRYNHGFF